MTPHIEQQILDGLKRRDCNSLVLLYNDLMPQIIYYAQCITRNRMEARILPLLQCINFWQQDLKKFDTIPKIKNFIFSIAKNASIDYLRKQKVIRANNEMIAFLSINDVTHIAEPDNDIALINSIYDEVSKLAPRTKQCFSLIYLEGLKSYVAAKKINSSPGIVRTLCFEALKKLKKKFRKEIY